MLSSIRQKPTHVRERYTLTITLVIMFFVVVLWGYSLKDNFSAAPKVAAADSAPSPAGLIKRAWNDLSSSIGNFTSSVKGSMSASTYESTQQKQ